MSRLRVLELIKTLDLGGAEKLLVERLAVRSREDFDVRVAFLDPDRNSLADTLSKLDVPTICLKARHRTSLSWMIRLHRLLRTQQPDVVNVHSPLMAVGVRLVIAALGSRRPALISTEHSLNYHRLTQWLNARTIRRDDLVIAVSSAVAHGPAVARAHAVRLVHHGTDLARARQLRAQRTRISHDLDLPAGLKVVTVANYRPEKDLPTLLAAAELVHQSAPDAHFLLAGVGPELELLRSQVETRRMSHYVHLLGQVPDAIRLTACADVFVLTSIREGLPVAAMEALGCGVPIVATDVGGLGDLVSDGDNGYLTRPRSPAETARRVFDLLSDAGLRAKMGTAASQSSQRFDIRSTNATIESIYREVAAKRIRG